jgi:hypothetical protein
MHKFKLYLFNNLIAADQWLNVLAGGSPHETCSSRIGRIKESHGGAIPWYNPIPKIIDAGLDRIQKNHSINAIERDEFQHIQEESVFDGNVDIKKEG